MSATHMLGGRLFREPAKSTIAHDAWVMDQVRATGLERLQRRPDEAWEDFGIRLTETVLSSGRALDLLAGLLVPAECDDLQWTPAMAREVAAFLGNLSEPADKETVHVLIGRLVAGFFAEGVLSESLSRVSSARLASRVDSSQGAAT